MGMKISKAENFCFGLMIMFKAWLGHIKIKVPAFIYINLFMLDYA